MYGICIDLYITIYDSIQIPVDRGLFQTNHILE